VRHKREFLSSIAVLCLLVSVAAFAATPGRRLAAGGDNNGIPQAFRITPARQSNFSVFAVVYNPAIDLFVVFYLERTDMDIACSRLFNGQGQPKSGPQKIFEMDKYTISSLSAAYNAREDRFLLIGTDQTHDAINGMVVDGRGRAPGGQQQVIPVKKSTGALSAWIPVVNWISSTNQYAVTWTYYDKQKPSDARSGQYLTVLNGDFSRYLNPKLVKPQTMKNDLHIPFLAVLENKLVWGSSEDGAGSGIKPVVWFTDFKGKIQTNIGAKGMIYPEGTAKAVTWVRPVYDPDHGRILLHWEYSDKVNSFESTYVESHYRLMDARGRFKTGIRVVPKREPFQFSGEACYNPAEKRFFWVCPEYKILHQASPERRFFGGKLWGFYLDHDGNFEDKQGNGKLDPIPLTYTFLDPSADVSFDTMAHDSKDNSYLAVYGIERMATTANEVWGFIYK
jgi:hypothetical protein